MTMLAFDSMGRHLTALELMCIIISCCIHDVGHYGVNNDFLVKTQHEWALIYNDTSVNENMHVRVAFEILQEPQCNIFESACLHPGLLQGCLHRCPLCIAAVGHARMMHARSMCSFLALAVYAMMPNVTSHVLHAIHACDMAGVQVELGMLATPTHFQVLELYWTRCSFKLACRLFCGGLSICSENDQRHCVNDGHVPSQQASPVVGQPRGSRTGCGGTTSFQHFQCQWPGYCPPDDRACRRHLQYLPTTWSLWSLGQAGHRWCVEPCMSSAFHSMLFPSCHVAFSVCQQREGA
jgi:hypothetical protein